MAQGLLGGVLPAIYSGADQLKRGVYGLLTNPMEQAERAGQSLLQSRADRQALMARTFANPERPFQVTDQAGLAQLGTDVLTGELGIAPIGMTKLAPANSSLIPIYHGTDPKAAKAIEKSGFDINKSADGTIWFTSNPDIGEVAATGKGAVVQRYLNENKVKLGGWDEIDKYSVDELLQKGYDGVKLQDETGTVFQIFNPQKLNK
jgi:hypothetical protein